MALNWNNAGAGAATGIGLGAPYGPVGAAAGGLIGGAAGLFGFGKGKKSKIKEHQNFSPEQQSLIDELVEGARSGNQNAMQYLNSILSEEEGAFEDYERPFKQQFEQETVPNILERFSGAGARSSSAIGHRLAQAGKELSGNLASQRANLKQNAIQQLMGFTNTALTKKTTPYIQEGRKSAWSDLAPQAAQGASQGLDDFLAWYQKQKGI